MKSTGRPGGHDFAPRPYVVRNILVTATVTVSLLTLACSHGRPKDSQRFVTAAQRMRALRRAHVWARRCRVHAHSVQTSFVP